MWLFSWNTNSDFLSHYDIIEQESEYCDKSIWSLFQAKKKSTGEPLSIFRFDIQNPHDSNVERARQSLKKIKTLRHPSILKYVDSCENEKSICIVTEAITPLEKFLNIASETFTDSQRNFSIAYGLMNVAKGLSFMNGDCQLNHNNINIHSIFVNFSGVWKIGGLERVCSVEETPPPLHKCLDERYDPPERLDPAKAKHPGGKFAVDSWGMGCLVWESFNNPLAPGSSVKTVGKMPKSLSVHYNKLVQTSPKHRVSPMDFINNCKAADIFFNSPPLKVMLLLDEIQLVKDPNEKEDIFKQLEAELASFPDDICKNKILPDLINAFDYGEAGSSIIDPILKIGKSLDEKQFKIKIIPIIIKLYACKDRATRSKMLKHLKDYVQYLESDVIDNMFTHIVQGMMDSNATIREQTLDGTKLLLPKLRGDKKESAFQHIIRLMLRDEELRVRMKAISYSMDFSDQLDSSKQVNILLPSYFRALHNPCPHSRRAIIRCLGTIGHKCGIDIITRKIMPPLCLLLADADNLVKEEASRTLKALIDETQDPKGNSTSEPSGTKSNQIN